MPPLSDPVSRSHRIHAASFLDDMIAVSAWGDLPKVQRMFEEWQSKSAPKPVQGGPDDPTSALSEVFKAAVENCRLEVIANLMENGFRLNLGSAYAAAKTKSIPVFQTLLDHGWDINQNGRGFPCLGHDWFIFDDPLREWFLAHGADPHIPNTQGFNCFDYAAHSTNPDVDPVAVLNSLVEHGGQPARSSALPIAASRPFRPTSECIEIMTYLLDHGAQINEREMEWRPERHEHCRSRMMKGTPLHVAVRGMDEEMVDFLLERGADPMVEDWSGCTALTVKCWQGDPKWEAIREKLIRAVEASGSARDS